MGEIIQFPRDRWVQDDDIWEHEGNLNCLCNDCVDNHDKEIDKMLRTLMIPTDDPDA